MLPPRWAASGTLTLSYTYVNDAGTAGNGSVSIPYTATAAQQQQHLYATNFSSNRVSYCPINADGSLGACATTGSGLYNPQGIAFSGNYVYIANSNGSSVTTCSVHPDGSFSGCSNAGFAWPGDLTANPAAAYVYLNTNGALDVCGGGAGALSSCASTGSNIPQLAFSVTGSQAYGTVTTYTMFGSTSSIELCAVQLNGALTNCAATGSNTSSAGDPQGVYGNYLYLLGGSGLLVCPIELDGTLGTCSSLTVSGTPQGAAFLGGYAYINLYPSTVKVCPINPNGTLGSCTTDSDSTFNVIRSVAIH